MQPREDDLYVLILQTLGKVCDLGDRLIVNNLRIPQTEQERRMPTISTVVVDGPVDRLQMLIKVHEAYGT